MEIGGTEGLGEVKEVGLERAFDGGRITIIKSILTGMPLYNMSFLPVPKVVANQLKSLQCKFLWGGTGDHKKVV